MKIRHFTDLMAWQEAHKLALLVYKETKGFPKEEQYSLTNQLRRAAISAPSNIAEGFGRETEADRVNFYTIARASIVEVQSESYQARDLAYYSAGGFERVQLQAETAHKLINGLIRKIRNDM